MATWIPITLTAARKAWEAGAHVNRPPAIECGHSLGLQGADQPCRWYIRVVD